MDKQVQKALSGIQIMAYALNSFKLPFLLINIVTYAEVGTQDIKSLQFAYACFYSEQKKCIMLLQ